MSHRSICRWVAKARQQDLEDTARSGDPQTTATKSNIRKITDLNNAR